MDILSKLGIDWRLLIGQIINFLVVLLILYKFAYHPILNMLKKREEKIAKSLSDAQKIEENLKQAEVQKNEIAIQARKEAEEMIKKTETAGEKLMAELAEKAQSEAEKIMAKAKKQIEEEKSKMLSEVKKYTVDLVVAVTEKILAEKITDKKDRELIEGSIKDI